MSARLRYLRHRDLDGLERNRLDHMKNDLALGVVPGRVSEYTFTADNTTNQITVNAEDSLAVGNPSCLLHAESGGTLPAELESGTKYWLADAGVNLYTLHPSLEDAVAGTNTVAFSDNGVATLTLSLLD